MKGMIFEFWFNDPKKIKYVTASSEDALREFIKKKFNTSDFGFRVCQNLPRRGKQRGVK